MFSGGVTSENIYGFATNGTSYAAPNAQEAAQFAQNAKNVLWKAIDGLIQRYGSHLNAEMKGKLADQLNGEFGKTVKQMMGNGKNAADVQKLFKSPQVVDRFRNLIHALSRSYHGSQVGAYLAELRSTVHKLSGFKSVGQRVADGFNTVKNSAGAMLNGVKDNAIAVARQGRQFAANGRAALAGAGAGAVATGQAVGTGVVAGGKAALAIGSLEVGTVASVGGGASAGGITAAGAATVGGAVVLAGGVGYGIGTAIDNYLPMLWDSERNLSDHVADGFLAIEEFVTGKGDAVEEVETEPVTPADEVKEEPQILCAEDTVGTHVRN